MNEHLKLKTVNRDRTTVWGGVSSGDGTRPGAQNRQKLPILDPQILSLNILISDCCLLKFGCLFYMIYLRPQKFDFNTYLVGGRALTLLGAALAGVLVILTLLIIIELGLTNAYI